MGRMLPATAGCSIAWTLLFVLPATYYLVKALHLGDAGSSTTDGMLNPRCSAIERPPMSTTTVSLVGSTGSIGTQPLTWPAPIRIGSASWPWPRSARRSLCAKPSCSTPSWWRSVTPPWRRAGEEGPAGPRSGDLLARTRRSGRGCVNGWSVSPVFRSSGRPRGRPPAGACQQGVLIAGPRRAAAGEHRRVHRPGRFRTLRIHQCSKRRAQKR